MRWRGGARGRVQGNMENRPLMHSAKNQNRSMYCGYNVVNDGEKSREKIHGKKFTGKIAKEYKSIICSLPLKSPEYYSISFFLFQKTKKGFLFSRFRNFW